MRKKRMTLREKYSLKGNIILEASKDNTLVGGVGAVSYTHLTLPTK